MSTEAKKPLTEEEKIERQVKGLKTRGLNIYAEGAALVAELKKLGEKQAKYRIDLVKAIQAGIVHPDFPAVLGQDQRHFENALIKEMARLKVPAHRRIPSHGYKPMMEQAEADFALLKAEFPTDRADRLEKMQREWEASEAKRAEANRREALIYTALADALSSNLWPEDEDAWHHIVRWVKKHHETVVTLEEVKAALTKRGYFDPNIRHNV